MSTFYDQPILNSPYGEPTRHHALDERGLPTDKPPVEGRRSSALLSPIPKFRKQRGKNKADAQQDLGLHADDGVSDDKQQYATTTLINEIRAQVSQWRRLPNPNDWQVTPTTRKLLEYWRSHEFQTIRPFFCQVEAVETLIRGGIRANYPVAARPAGRWLAARGDRHICQVRRRTRPGEGCGERNRRRHSRTIRAGGGPKRPHFHRHHASGKGARV